MSIRSKIVPVGVALTAMAVMAGCGDSTGTNAVVAAYGTPPVVTGMILTDYVGNAYGIWGQPTATLLAFPNVSDGPTTIFVPVERNCRLQIWVVKAYGPDESYDSFVSGAGGSAYVPYGTPIRKLYDAETTGGVRYTVVWDYTDESGAAFPPGFYRVYAAMGSALAWADLFYGRECADFPAYMIPQGCEDGD